MGAFELSLDWLARRMATPPARTVLLADGVVPTVELVRQVIHAASGGANVPVCTGADCYKRLQGLAEIESGVHWQFVRTTDAEAFDLVQRMQAARLPYSFVIDDNFWLLLDDKAPLHRYYQNPLVRRALQSVLVGADVVLCYSEHFRQFLLPFTPRVAVVPAAFDFSVLEGLPAPEVPQGELRIGIVGNSSRAADLAVLVPVIERVLATRPEGVVFEFFGYTPPELEGLRGVRSIPAVSDYKAYIAGKIARGWLLALAPLGDGRFAEYKTNNKLREFGACSIAAIYSDMRIYRECVQPGRTGWLVGNDTQAWVDAILHALADPEATRQVGRNAHDYVLAHHHLREVAARWKAALEPTLDKVVRTQHSVRRNWRRLAEAARTPAVSQTFALGGPSTPPSADERHGLYLREALFELHPGQELACEVPAPAAGPYRWSGMMATYCEALTGELVLTVEDRQGVLATTEWPLAGHGDGASFHVEATLGAPGQVTIRAINRASGPVALHALGRAGTSRFAGAAEAIPLAFLA